MTKTIKELNIHFYVSIIVLAVLFLLVLINPGGMITSAPAKTLTLEMYAIGITLIAIPVALKLFADRVKKIPKGADRNNALKSYKNAYFLRLCIINAVVLGNILLFAVSRNSNFMWLSVISFIVYMFCRPSQQELDNITREEDA